MSTTAARDAKRQAYADYDRRLADEYRSPLGGNSTDKPETGFGSAGPKGSKVGDPCSKDGYPGTIQQAPDGGLYCSITPVHPRNADAEPDFRRKTKRNARNQEQSEEEFERDAMVRDAIITAAREAGLVDQDEDKDWDESDWDRFMAMARRAVMGEEDDDDPVDVVVENATTHTESAPLPRFDGMTLDQLRARHAEQMRREYALADAEQANAWRKQ